VKTRFESSQSLACGGALALLLTATTSVALAADSVPIDDLLEMDLSELMKLEISLVARQPRRVADSAASVYVIDRQKIRRSGATSVTELLRLVPGLYVSSLNRSVTAVGVRGMGGSTFNPRLLVLVDGRSVYTPLYSGVHWEMQEVMLEDVERIEVVRGPGASLWGSNAVDGVINIVSRSAAATRGGLVSARAGNQDPGHLAMRWGGALGETGDYRVYGKFFERDSWRAMPSAQDPDGKRESNDDWRQWRVGFRADWTPADNQELMLLGDLQRGVRGRTRMTMTNGEVEDEVTAKGANLMLRWSRTAEGGRQDEVQAWYDYIHQGTGQLDSIEQEIHTFDIDYHSLLALSESTDLMWGLGYRHRSDDIRGTDSFQLEPDSIDSDLWTAFVQSEFHLGEARQWHLTLGSKIEQEQRSPTLTFQPSARLLWESAPHHTLWAAVSRAVRNPSRIDRDVRVPLFGPYTMRGNPDVEPTKLLSRELGYRYHPARDLSLDITYYRNTYSDVIDIQEFDPADLQMDVFNNGRDERTQGIEFQAEWRVNEALLLEFGYSWFDMLQLASGLDETPRHQFHLRGQWDLAHDWHLDLIARHQPASSINNLDEAESSSTPSRTSLDFRLAKQYTPNLEIALIGRNLLDAAETEEPSQSPLSTQVERSIHAQVTWEF
jgi:iron complex outermembrane receptor protein